MPRTKHTKHNSKSRQHKKTSRKNKAAKRSILRKNLIKNKSRKSNNVDKILIGGDNEVPVPVSEPVNEDYGFNDDFMSNLNKEEEKIKVLQTKGRKLVRSKPSGQKLLEICKEACDIMTPMLRIMYNKMCESETSSIKSNSPIKREFTIADGLVQYFLEKILFKDKFMGIIGEEDVDVQINSTPYKIGNIDVPSEFEEIIDTVKTGITNLLNNKFNNNNYKDKYVFIDPIDGTREFSTGKGYDSTICIGFSNADGSVFAGIVYRPIPIPDIIYSNNVYFSPNVDNYNGVTYAYGCKSEKFIVKNLNMLPNRTKNTLLTSRGSTSLFLQDIYAGKIKDGETWTQIPYGGAGNKMLNLLEGKGEAYIQDRGLSRWDTCAAQAIIEAAGGICCKLTKFLENGVIESYHYQNSQSNLDFDFTAESINKPKLILYNMSQIIENELKELKDKTPKLTNFNKKLSKYNNTKNIKKIQSDFLLSKPFSQDNFKPYSNLCGIVAFLYPENADDIQKTEYKNNMYTLCKDAEKKHRPEYD
jgi:3'-phosphoadenosine 5'-phosphosulfate (PAPS) 3'-phosphatase